ncbi:transmembrane protein 26-like [Spea bombifrons]|uniref:transmembrane protein 26-like n=1 Tax=Spea bombifrons TaxID=233779 RepID=UPI00234BBD7E|nr:transmembrane protein 26-like [Spea bombifrons]
MDAEPLEQVMVLVLVIGRWLMPKGEMTRDQLAELLRIYIGLGADILDLLRLIKEPIVAKNKNVTIAGLSLFGWALMQFTLVLTQTQSSQHKETRGHPEEDPEAAVTEDGCWSWCTIDVWPLVIAVVMQDGPFLAFRLYLIVIHKMNTKTMIFFICKNILTLIIEIYNIIVVLRAHKQKDKK